jgi:hypothetical protein
VAKGLAPWASVWCGGEWANAYRLIALGGGSYTDKIIIKARKRPIRQLATRGIKQ